MRFHLFDIRKKKKTFGERKHISVCWDCRWESCLQETQATELSGGNEKPWRDEAFGGDGPIVYLDCDDSYTTLS